MSGKPKVTILRQSHFVQIGTTVTCVCTIESNPPVIQVWWTHNQTQAITDKLRYNGGNIHNHNLSIISAKDSDSGVYTCNAKNAEGTSASNTTLITGSEYSLYLYSSRLKKQNVYVFFDINVKGYTVDCVT